MLASLPPAPPEGAPEGSLALYGAGNLGKLARAWAESTGTVFDFVLDRAATRLAGDPAWSHHWVRDPADVPSIERSRTTVVVSVALAPFAPLRAQLLNEGWANVRPFYDLCDLASDRHPLGNGWRTGGLSGPQLDALEQVSLAWGDDTSRAHHLAFVAWHHARQEWIFDDAPVQTSDRYACLSRMATLSQGARVVDVGTHEGEGFASLHRAFPGSFGSVDAVEPDEHSAIACVQKLRTVAPDVPLRLHREVLSSGEDARLFADGLGYASQLWSRGRAVRTRRLDDVVDGADLLKIHVEGHELDVLSGGRGIVKADRPIIAATGYHNAEGVVALPQWIQQLDGYVCFARAHAYHGTGLVLYAIPQERVR